MYAFQLPRVIAPAGVPGGPPLPRDYRDFAGGPGSADLRLTFLDCIHNPQQLQPTWERDLWRRGRKPGSKFHTRRPRDKVAKSVSSRKSLRVFCDPKGKLAGEPVMTKLSLPLAPAGEARLT